MPSSPNDSEPLSPSARHRARLAAQSWNNRNRDPLSLPRLSKADREGVPIPELRRRIYEAGRNSRRNWIDEEPQHRDEGP